jgi:hypothetical protein
MDKLTNRVVDTSLTGNQLKEICISIGIKYYLPKAGCVERIKKRLAVVEKEEADRVVETNRGKKRETRQSLAKNNKKLKVETTKRITRATVKQSEERDDGDEDEEIIEDEEINDEQEDTGDNVEFDDTVIDATWEPDNGVDDVYKDEDFLRFEEDIDEILIFFEKLQLLSCFSNSP